MPSPWFGRLIIMSKLVVVELCEYPGPRLMCGEDTAQWLERMGIVKILDTPGQAEVYRGPGARV